MSVPLGRCLQPPDVCDTSRPSYAIESNQERETDTLNTTGIFPGGIHEYRRNLVSNASFNNADDRESICVGSAEPNDANECSQMIKENLQVYLRVRPFTQQEIEQGEDQVSFFWHH